MRRLRIRPPRHTRPRRDPRYDDRGAVATLVAILFGGGVLLGMVALTVDVGQLYAERRQLQNGADAAALAVAMSCAPGTACDTSTTGQARTLANANANDAASQVLAVCGAGSPSLTGCPAPAGPQLTRCAAAPSGVLGWAQVRTGTLTTGGTTLLPPSFARALAGNGGYAGTQVLACAQAAWGPPAVLAKAVPLIFSECEWDAAAKYPAPPPYPPYPPGEVVLKLHTTKGVPTCPAGPSGADLPGGYGWLDSDATCSVAVTGGGTVPANPGVGDTCADFVAGLVGTVIHLPIYDGVPSGTGATASYHVKGFAAFYLDGYSLPSAHPKSSPPHGGVTGCKGSEKCIYGWFLRALVPTGGSIGTGPPMGSLVVALTG